MSAAMRLPCGLSGWMMISIVDLLVGAVSAA
jgi:hypothetical protein